MKPGYSKSTYHTIELRPKPGEESAMMNEWDPDTRSFKQVVKTYFYCTSCNQYAWSWKSMCPIGYQNHIETMTNQHDESAIHTKND